MIPIEKNISVIDEFGNEYEATYPKRARGLVKKGRARFVDENTICLACPPDIMEDTNMSDNKNVNAVKEQEVKEITVTETAKVTEEKSEEAVPTMAYVLKQIELIRQDNEHIDRALNALMSIKTGVGPGDVAGQEQAKGIADTVRCRETTNQKLIEFYARMYDDLKPKDEVTDKILDLFRKTYASDLPVEEIENLTLDLSSAWNKIITNMAEKSFAV